MNAFIMTKKAVAIGLAATALVGGGIAAEASGTTTLVTGRGNAHVAVQSDHDRALEALATLEANAHADAGLDRARAAIAADRPLVDVTADVSARADGGAGIGAQVSAEAQTRKGSMKDFVLGLLGIETGRDAHAKVATNAHVGTDNAINAVTDAKANAAADAGIATALNAIGHGQADVAANSQVNANAGVGLSTALNAVTSVGAEASGGVSSNANANAQTVLEGLGATAGTSAEGSAGLRLGLVRAR